MVSEIPDDARICERNLFLSALSPSARHSVAIQEGYRAIQPRTQLSLGRDLLYRTSDRVIPIMPDSDQNQTLIQVFESEIERLTRDVHGAICVHLSGGFDSTAILASIPKGLRRNVIATTWVFTDGSAHNDRIYAKRVAEYYSINHVEIEIDPSKLYSVPGNMAKNTWSVSNSISAVSILFDEIASIGADKETLFLDGHGGDHMMVDPLPAYVILDIVKRSGPLVGIRKFREFVDLHSTNFLTVASRLFREEDMPTDLPVTTAGRALLPPKQSARSFCPSFQDFRVRSTMSALTDNRTGVEPLGYRYAYPFTEGKFPAAAMQIPPEALFDREYPRSALRNELIEKHGSSLFLRRDKGYSTGAFQVATRMRQAELTEIIRSGRLAQSRLIDVDRCLNELMISAKGMKGLSWAVNMIIAAELTVLALEGRDR